MQAIQKTGRTNYMLRMHDARGVDHVWKHPEVFPDIADDYVTDPDKFDTEILLQNESIYVLGGFHNFAITSIFYYQPHNTIMYEVHSAVLPEYRGKQAIEFAKLSLDSMFTETACMKVITHVPEGNPAAYALARRVGMVKEGVNRASIMKNGKLIDQVFLGITKEEFQCQ